MNTGSATRKNKSLHDVVRGWLDDWIERLNQESRRVRRDAKARRGVVTEKHRIRTIFGGHFYALVVRPDDDAACEDWIEAPKALWESVTIEGLGDDAIVEYGIGKPDIPRRVS